MSTQPELFAHARRDDPITSHQAAASVGPLRPRQEAVLETLTRIQPATHEQIVAAYVGPPQTEQSIRSRCAELVDLERVQPFDREGRTCNGRRATRWQVT